MTALTDTIREAEQAIRRGLWPDNQAHATIRMTAPMRTRMHDLLTRLGYHVADAVAAAGGLVLVHANTGEPVSADEENRILHIVTIAGLGAFASREILPLFADHYREVGRATAQAANAAFGLNVNPNEVAQRVLLSGGRRAGLVDLSESTKRGLFNVLEHARQEGVGVRKLGRQTISHMVGAGRFVNAGPQYRGQLIARTETLHAQRISQIETFKSSAAVKGLLASDGDADEECANRNGNVYTFDEAEVETEGTHPQCVLCWSPWTF